MLQKQEEKQSKYSYLADILLPWFAENARDLPWRKDKEPYHIWLSEIMLQQTRVEAVKGYYHRFLEQLPDIKSLAEASEDQILKLWEGLGYYSRVRNLQKAAQVIMEQHNGIFPEDYKSILALPGIGDYTAGAIASICFNQPTPAVDGNVLRIV
ncbi:MAG: A/G-specific adenine glycosylase, partial [Peptococcaceae bacterium]|nr:A/G-specific adenine glycosylase [Peptococcaceae bacterium]